MSNSLENLIDKLSTYTINTKDTMNLKSAVEL